MFVFSRSPLSPAGFRELIRYMQQSWKASFSRSEPRLQEALSAAVGNKNGISRKSSWEILSCMSAPSPPLEAHIHGIPIIYALRSKDLRHAFRSMFPSCEGTAQPLDNSMGDSDCLHKHANNAASVHRAAESCIKSTVKIAKVTMSVSTDTSAEAVWAWHLPSSTGKEVHFFFF